jgi:hypothetical protein
MTDNSTMEYGAGSTVPSRRPGGSTGRLRTSSAHEWVGGPPAARELPGRPRSVRLCCLSYQAEMQEWSAQSNSHSARRRGWLFRLTAVCRFRPRAIAPTQPAIEQPQLPDRRCRSSRNRLHGHLGPASVISAISAAIPPAVRLGCADPQRMTLYAASPGGAAIWGMAGGKFKFALWLGVA